MFPTEMFCMPSTVTDFVVRSLVFQWPFLTKCVKHAKIKNHLCSFIYPRVFPWRIVKEASNDDDKGTRVKKCHFENDVFFE